MANYENRLERLEQTSSAKWEPLVLAYLIDSDERPADELKLQDRCFVRDQNETLDELTRRAKKAVGIAADKTLYMVHYVQARNAKPRFSDAEYSAAGVASVTAEGNSG